MFLDGTLDPPREDGVPTDAPRTLLRAAFCARPYQNAAPEGPQWLAADPSPSEIISALSLDCRWFSQPKIELPAKG